MKKLFKLIGILAGIGILVVIVMFALLPWMDRWGATNDEIAASFSGDELVPSPRLLYTRSVTVNATPEQIYPWIVQLGADKAGMYSYTWLESLIQCPQTNADRIHEEWQDLKVGDKVLMCPDVNAPPAYEVALIEPNRAIVMGHKRSSPVDQANGTWSDVWQFILLPQSDGTTRLILRSRSTMEGLLWDAMRPGEFIMVRGRLLTLKQRAENTDFVPPVSNLKTVSMSEFGRDISLSYDPKLTSSVGTGTVPAVPISDQVMFAESHPAYAQIRFMGFLNGWKYDLPIYAENRVAQVMVFRISDFPGYGDDSLQGFVNQSQALSNLLQNGVDASHCAQPLMDYESALPFLPWTNSKQAFCSQPKVIDFANGIGIRYLTYYAQDPSPALESHIFYTFQGITNDGQFYVSAFFPVQTGIFPNEPPACPQCGEPNYDPFAEWTAVLTEQLDQLNAQPGDEFAPSLKLLDQLIESIHIDN
ncbi:MAG TPA: hypothetical protein VMN99_14140 [Anaerolineales bacterium]|nr:hypothetical protein [Anaerolineales bacterium]